MTTILLGHSQAHQALVAGAGRACTRLTKQQIAAMTDSVRKVV